MKDGNHAYEVEGLRDNLDEVFAVEILGYQTLEAALLLAQDLADRWQATVNLIRVPFIHTGSASWSDEQVELVQQLLPSRPVQPP